jgi:hypothetical protein
VNEVADYVAQVRTALADLPAAARDELLEDLPEHLAEVAAEGEGSLAERLGPPAAYAAELRAAAGVPAGRRRRRLTLDPRLRDVVGKVRARLQAIDTRTGPLVGYARGSDFLLLLRPAWWVVRGYLLAMALADLPAKDSIGLLPRIQVGDSTLAGLVLLAGFVIGSIWLGQRQGRLPRPHRIGLAAVIALLMLPGIGNLMQVDHDTQRRGEWEVAPSIVDVTPAPSPSATG